MMHGSRRRSTIVTTTAAQRRVERSRWLLAIAATCLVALVIAVTAYFTAPRPFALALLGVVIVCWAAFVRPAIGVYAVIFFTLIGDNQTTEWWPFTMNLSMRQSIFFVHDSLAITPLELVLAAAWSAFLLRKLVDPEWRFRRGRMLAPLAVFGGFVLWGITRGFFAGWDRNVALLEFRPLLYLIALYALIPNVLVTAKQFRIAFGLAIGAVAFQSIFSLHYYRNIPAGERGVIESLSEHTAAVAMNLVFVFFIGLLAFGGSRWLRWTTAVAMIPVVFAFGLSQRRAAAVALFVGLIVLAAVVYARERRLFWKVVPAIAACAVLVVVATWNATGAGGTLSNAVKTVLFPGALSEQDRVSSEYRGIENYNLWYTIRSSPLFGLGFGRTFLVVRPMPDISFFEQWQYFSHNSVLWVWIKTGFGGFVAMLFTFARVIQRGAHAAVRMARPNDVAMIVAALSYPMMFLTFAYVDIAFSIRPVVVLALSFALCADFEPTVDPASLPRATVPVPTVERARLAA
jgi:hypothetical protein